MNSGHSAQQVAFSIDAAESRLHHTRRARGGVSDSIYGLLGNGSNLSFGSGDEHDSLVNSSGDEHDVLSESYSRASRQPSEEETQYEHGDPLEGIRTVLESSQRRMRRAVSRLAMQPTRTRSNNRDSYAAQRYAGHKIQ